MSYQDNPDPTTKANINKANRGSDPLPAVYSNNQPASGRGVSYKNAVGQNQQAPQQLPQQAPIPQTILLDCNRANCNNTKNGANALHKWTCEFAGGIEVKTGDQISVNSAYLNSIGVGDLIAWTNSGDKQDNKCKWLIEYYCSNDGKNDKREGYNLKYGSGGYPYPYDNKPAELYRTQNKVEYRDQNGARTHSGTDFSFTNDPYINGRWFGLRNVVVPTSLQVSRYKFLLTCWVKPKTSANNTWSDNPFMLLKLQHHEINQAYINTDVRKVIPACSYFRIEATEDQDIPIGGADPATYNQKTLNYKFFCYGHLLDNGIYYAMVERPLGFVSNGNDLTNPLGDRRVTANIHLLGGRGSAKMEPSTATGGKAYGRVCNYNDVSNYAEVGQHYYLYSNVSRQINSTTTAH